MSETLIIPRAGQSIASALQSATTQVDVSAATAPTTGQILTAVDSQHATWQAPAGGAPSGAAGGVLKGTYPNPEFDPSKGLVWGQTVSGTFYTMPWFLATSGGANLPSGASSTLHLGYFTAPYSKSITTLGFICHVAGSGGATTIGKLAIWAANNDGTTSAGPLAVTANDTAMVTTANNYYTAAISSTALTAGTRYALGILVVHSHSTLPKFGSTTNAIIAGMFNAPIKVGALVTTQSDMPAGAIASVSNNTQPPLMFCL